MQHKFDPPGPGAWESTVRRMLEGADPDTTLGTRTDEGLVIRPLYTELPMPGHRGEPGPTGLRVVLSYEDVSSLSLPDAIAHDLSHGAEGVWLPAAAATSQPAWIDAITRVSPPPSVFFDLSGIFTESGAASPLLGDLLEAVGSADRSRTGGVGTEGRRWIFEADPLSHFAQCGHLDPDAAFPSLAQVLEWCDQENSGGSWLISSVPYHEAGAGPALELGALLAAIVDTLRHLDSQSGSPGLSEVAVSRCVIRTPISQEYFSEIAKLRAIFQLWDAVLHHAALPPSRPLIHATASRRMLSIQEPELNVLRGTQAAFAALVGGADFFTPVAHDARVEERSSWGRRIARNTPLILRDESQLIETSDPAAGSYFLESMTEDLAGAAWDVFRTIEADGGLARSLQRGRLQDLLEEASQKRGTAIASGERKIVGENTYIAEGVERCTVRSGPSEPDPSSDALAPQAGSGLRCRALKTKFDTDSCADRTAP